MRTYILAVLLILPLALAAFGQTPMPGPAIFGSGGGGGGGTITGSCATTGGVFYQSGVVNDVTCSSGFVWNATTGLTLNRPLNATAIAASATLRTGGYTVATLPAGSIGMTTYVTDATATSGTLTGGGSNIVQVWYNGTAWVISGGGGTVDTAFIDQLKWTRVSSTLWRMTRGKWAETSGGATWNFQSWDCTITAGTSTGPWSAFTALNGTVVLLYPTGLTVSCALTTGEIPVVGDLTVIPTSTDPGTRVTLLATGTITSGQINTDLIDRRSPINGSYVTGTRGVVCTTTAGVTTCQDNPAWVGNIASSAVITGDWDFRAATASLPHRTGAGAPSAGSCTAANVAATYTNTNNGGGTYDCLQTGASTYTWVLSGSGSGGFTMSTYGQGYQNAGTPATSNVPINAADTFGNALVPFFMASRLTGIVLSKISLDIIGQTPTGSNGWAVGVYDAGCNKIAEKAQVIAGASPRYVTFTLSPAVTLADGWYFIAIAHETASATTNIFELTTNNNMITRMNTGTSATYQFFTGTAATGTGASIVMPATCGTRVVPATGVNGLPWVTLEP